MKDKKTTVGVISDAVLSFTAGNDIKIDEALIEVDCICNAAHVNMLSKIDLKSPIISSKEYNLIIKSLNEIIDKNNDGKFKIRLSDQDVHLAIERTITDKLGKIGKKIHTGRSRNDQIATDLRLLGKEQLIQTIEDSLLLIESLVKFGKKHNLIPMVGRTHMQPGMPSSVGLWITSYAESLLDDCSSLLSALELCDQSPLGSAASYGVSIPINRNLTSKLMGFSKPIHNVLYANNSRGKIESIILSSMSQVMLTLSRLAQDLILFNMPEFSYFEIPSNFCTGSSIMPQKNNLDVCELIRAKASKVKMAEVLVFDLVKNLSGGYSRDLQEAKEPFIEGMANTRACLQILNLMITEIKINKEALLKGFHPSVFATDYALSLVEKGMNFRDAYISIKKDINILDGLDPHEAVKKKTHLGAPAGLDWIYFSDRVKEIRKLNRKKRVYYESKISSLLERKYSIK